MTDRVRSTGSGRSVLVVDDEPALRLLLTRFLEGEGYEVLSAGNGLDALDVVRTYGPDAVLLDLVMPELDGWEFLRTCRASPELADLPVVVMSATPNLGQSLTELKVSGCLSKPFDLDSVTDALETIWDALPICNICGSGATSQSLAVFADGRSSAEVDWRLCRSCWRLLELGKTAIRPPTGLAAYRQRRGLHITETEVRAYVAAGIAAARRCRP